MMNEIAATTEETTAYALGTAISALMNLKRMVEQNMTDYGNNLEGVTGLHPMWGKQKLMTEFDVAIDRLNGIRYPYKY
jgi:prephenate dehydrogenase